MGTVSRIGRACWHGLTLGLVVLAVTLLGPVARADDIELDLYEKVALAPLVVHARVEVEPQRLAEIRVLEVIKGDYPRTHLSVAFRLINFERPYGQEKISFEEGEEALLCLVPLRRADGRIPHEDRFILFKGPDGKIPLPVEGRRVWLDATHRAAQIAAIENSGPLFEALRGLVGSQNPVLIDIGLRQVRKHALVDERLLPALLKLVQEPDGPFGAPALELVADLLQKPAFRERPLASRDHLVALATTIADHAPEADTRRAAVRLLASDGTSAARAKLEAIAEADPSQDVRYEAAVAIYQLRSIQR